MTTKLKLPAILLAHDLRNGKVLYWHKSGWLDELQSPIIADNDAIVAQLVETIKIENAKNIVVDASIEEITIDENNQIIFRHFRERIKQSGPTIRYGVANV